MAHYLNAGGKWRLYRDEAMDIRNVLPAGNYIISQSETGELFLEAVGQFTMPEKLYGDVTKNTARIMRTFFDRPQSTGVLLAGSKGSGKTLLSKNVCNELRKQSVPTIIVNAPLSGDQFNEFLQRIEQPCIVLFDEFEKVYMEPKQQFGLLTLLDGVFPSKKLFLLTCNSLYRIDDHMRNRPGRLFYTFKFRGMEREHIEEYCADKLNDQTQIEAICRISNVFSEFNFDMLAAMVEEMNRYNETPQEVLRVLNVAPEDDAGQFDVAVIFEGRTYRGAADFYDDDEHYSGPPTLTSRSIGFTLAKPNADDPNDREAHSVYFSSADFVKFDRATGAFHFERGGARLILTRRKPDVPFDYRAL
jgi:hypothetical protein